MATAQDFWQPANGPYGGWVNTIFINPSGIIFLGTGGGGIFRSADNENIWFESNNGLKNKQVDTFTENSKGTIFAGTLGGIYFSNDDGNMWQATGLLHKVVTSLAVDSNDVIYAAATVSGVFRSSDEGRTWAKVDSGLSPSIVTQVTINSNGVVFAGTSRGIYRWSEEDKIWRFSGLRDKDISTLVSRENGDLFASGYKVYEAGLYRSVNNGRTWELLGFEDDVITAIAFYSEDMIFAGSSFNSIFRSKDNALSWTQLDTSFKQFQIQSIAVDSIGNLYAGTGEDVFRSNDFGTNWTKINEGVTHTHINTLGNNLTGDVFAGTIRGRIFRTDNIIHGWQMVYSSSKQTGVQPDINDIVSGENGHIFVATLGQGILRSKDNGQSWVQINNELTPDNITALGLNAREDLLASTGSSIYRSKDDGDSWNRMNTESIEGLIRAFAVDSKGNLFCGVEADPIYDKKGGVYLSTDNGETWSLIGLDTTSISSLVVGPQGSVFAGTLRDGIFRFKDTGGDWILTNKGLTEFSISALAADSSGGLFAGTYSSGVFQSTDGGESWTTINTGLTNHSISSLLMSMDSHLFAGTHGNAVFRSAESVTSVKAVNKNELQSFVLEQNYPNPFNPSTEIRFELPVERHANLIIYNVLGRKIKTLVDEVKEAGSHSVTWDGTDENGQPVPSGVYFYRFDARMVSGTKKMILMR